MISKIEINIPNFNIVVNEENNINDIIRIMRYWDFVYKSDQVSNNLYTIKLYGKDIITYEFYNTFPEDFFLLTDYLGEIYGR